MSADYDEHDDGAGRDDEWVPAHLHEDCDCPACCDGCDCTDCDDAHTESNGERCARELEELEVERVVMQGKIDALLAGSVRRVQELEAEREVVHGKLLTLGESIHHLLAERDELHSALEETRAELDALRAHRSLFTLAPVHQLRPVGR